MLTVETEHPFATWSPDFINPKGSKTDSTTNQAWNNKLYGIIPAAEVRLLDLGCAGGGLVASVLRDGGMAAGIDGSDYGVTNGQGEWLNIPGNLMNADITKNFRVLSDGHPAKFNVITMWEVLEHIPEDLIPTVMGSIALHLDDDGIFVCSISRAADCHEGHDYHVCVKPTDWWRDTFTNIGWTVRDDLFDHFAPDWVRGPNNGMDSFPLVIS